MDLIAYVEETREGFVVEIKDFKIKVGPVSNLEFAKLSLQYSLKFFLEFQKSLGIEENFEEQDIENLKLMRV